MLRVLLTNDDGIMEPGLMALALELLPYCEVLVVAPDSASSGTSHSISIGKPLYLVELPDYIGPPMEKPAPLRAFACSGKPSDCVMLAHFVLAGERQPHIVLSGINNGCNVAEDLTYSGTVGAALEAAVLGLPGIAVSLDTERGDSDFDTAAKMASLTLALLVYGHTFPWQSETLRQMKDTSRQHFMDADELFWPLVGPTDPNSKHFPAPPDRWHPELIEHAPCFNINIPALHPAETAGIRWASAGVRKYSDVISRGTDAQGRECYFIGGEKVLQDDTTPGTDTHALRHGYISVTPMTYDLTNRHESADFREDLALRMARVQARQSSLERGTRE